MRTTLPSARLMLAATIVMLLTGCTTIPTVEEIVCGTDPITGEFGCVITTGSQGPVSGPFQYRNGPVRDHGGGQS